MHTRESLRAQLSSGGILPTDTVLVHSSMKSIGQVEGGADGVLDALMGYLG
ncbi:MAG TPA: AAC(3) family N-acetyltransferase, partial [Lentisphaeria bacterium]|nr:AAC(3) family N-acetyltransferase [Lentisphaeria bacterium]